MQVEAGSLNWLHIGRPVELQNGEAGKLSSIEHDEWTTRVGIEGNAWPHWPSDLVALTDGGAR